LFVTQAVKCLQFHIYNTYPYNTPTSNIISFKDYVIICKQKLTSELGYTDETVNLRKSAFFKQDLIKLVFFQFIKLFKVNFNLF